MIEPPEVFVFGPYMTNIDGKPGTVDPEVRVRRRRPRPRAAAAPPATADLHREHEVGGPEAGAPDDAVDLVLGAVGGAHAARRRSPVIGVGRCSSTSGRCSAGRKCELNSTRLQPKV